MDSIPFALAALAGAIRRREVTAERVAGEVLARCAAHGDLHAIISQDRDQLLAAAQAADAALRRGQDIGPLHGVPVLIKDNIDVQGYATTAGTPGLIGIQPREHAPAVRRLLEGGALIAGKANLHELAVGGTSHNRHFGDVGNPWQPGLIAGGSSGGSAVAVAARLVPAALGTDTNGSVRGPCAFQGIAGFRPTIGRYPYGGIIPGTPTRDTVGTMAVGMEDLLLLDQVLAPSRPLPPALALAGLRLGSPRGRFLEVTDGRTLAVFEAALALLRGHGATIVEDDIAGLHELASRAAWPISAWESRRELPAFLASRTTPVSLAQIVARIASPSTRERFNSPVADAAELERRWRDAMQVHRPRLQQALNGYFARHSLDALVFPTTPFPAVAAAHDSADLLINGQLVANGLATMIRNTVYQSAAGIPSLTVPAGLTADGLPVGLNFDGPAGSDERLLAIGQAFELARGTFPQPRRSCSGWM
ncbi:MAG: amidase family protein [Gammaproteobacteria bacterium]|nr:MAG: amidase family protein [Gammaproteobacteria bacterium]